MKVKTIKLTDDERKALKSAFNKLFDIEIEMRTDNFDMLDIKYELDGFIPKESNCHTFDEFNTMNLLISRLCLSTEINLIKRRKK